MKAKELIKKLSDLNVRLWAYGEKLRWDAPQGIVREDLVAEMKDHKLEILALLKAREIGEGKMVEIPIPGPNAVKRGMGDLPHVYRPRRIFEERHFARIPIQP